jgi:hypothetical protein
MKKRRQKIAGVEGGKAAIKKSQIAFDECQIAAQINNH